MRDLKFRAFCEVEIAGSPSGNIMVYFSHIELDNGLWYMPDDENIYHINEWLSKPMQFTGLKDKNGKDIYEGDVVNDYNINGVFRAIGIIEYHEWSYWVCNNTGKTAMSTFLRQLEVIGNVYETPGLLK